MKTHISNIRNYIGDREQINNIQIISACVLTPSLSNVKKKIRKINATLRPLRERLGTCDIFKIL